MSDNEKIPAISPERAERERRAHELFEQQWRDSFSVGLDQLADPEPGRRPPYSWPVLIRCAIQGSDLRRLTVQGIYEAIERRYTYYREETKENWKVRLIS